MTTVQSFPGILNQVREKDKDRERNKCTQAAGERDFCLIIFDLMLYPQNNRTREETGLNIGDIKGHNHP